jgi:nicotinate-nucleotide adenylyltransferase
LISTSDTLQPDAVLFGGAFDPPHAGHADCIGLVLEELPEARVHVVPAAAPAGASAAHKSPKASFADRLAMCTLAFAPFAPRVEVDDWEAQQPAPNYTVNTLAAAKARLPHRRLGFLIGQDQLEAFDRWHEPLAILEHATLLVAPRRGEAGDAAGAAAKLDAAIADLGKRLDKLATTPRRGPWPILPLHGVASPASSTRLRATFAHGETPPRDWLAPAVADYIEHHALYA